MTLLQDVRALGPTAPLRAAYELSKRSGLHGVLFRPGAHIPTGPAAPLRLGGSAPEGTRARERCLRDARQVVGQGVRVFGERVGTGVSTPWTADPLTGRLWPDGPWWQLDIRSPARLSDVKHVWEAGRHRDLVVLARAARVEPDGPWAGRLAAMLRAWCDECPPECGVHWYSSLEIALRTLSWAQVLDLAGQRLPADLRADLEAQLRAGGRHLLLELPYTLSSMRNNHLLGDALGLLALSRLFARDRAARRWAAVGERLFEGQLRRHVHPDGSMIEDSLSYHRFVLEMLAVRVLLGGASPAVTLALGVTSRHLLRIGAMDGPMPAYGDWDEGRVLASSGDPLDVAGSTALGLALTGAPVPPEWYDRFDELAWYAPAPVRGMLPPAAELDPSCPRGRRLSASGGIARVVKGPWTVWFKAGGGPSHGHADLTSVWVRHGARWVVVDPGTGTYNGPLEVRNGLRGSRAHPVLRLDDTDQLGPYRAFRWHHTARGHLAEPMEVAGRVVLFGWHDAYRRLPGRPRTGRAVVVADGYVAVVELPEHPDRVACWALTVPLHPDVTVHDSQLAVGGQRLPVWGLGSPAQVRGSTEPFAGWHSTTYGHWEPATWLEASGTGAPPAVWRLGSEPAHTGPGQVDGLALHVAWDDTGALLTVTDTATGAAHRRRARS